MSSRRPLEFKSLDDVMPEVAKLLTGYSKVGNWNLGQTCNHLTKGYVGSIEGFGFKAPWLLRHTLAPLILRNMFKTGKMREQVKVPASLLPRGDHFDDRAEAEALRAAVSLYKAHSSPLPDHPFFGKLTREQADLLHRIHSAHHLSFLLPS